MKITRIQLNEIIKKSIMSSFSLKTLYRLNEMYESYTSDEIVLSINRAFQILDIEDEVFKSFMKRLSKTESGGNPDGLDVITHHTSNPFQLDPPAVENIKKNVNMKKWRSFVDQKQGNNPANLSQLLENQSYGEVIESATLSALFAVLYVIWSLRFYDPQKRKNYDYAGKLGSTVEAQAKFWKDKYNTVSGDGKVTDFINKNKEL